MVRRIIVSVCLGGWMALLMTMPLISIQDSFRIPMHAVPLAIVFAGWFLTFLSVASIFYQSTGQLRFATALVGVAIGTLGLLLMVNDLRVHPCVSAFWGTLGFWGIQLFWFFGVSWYAGTRHRW